MIKRVNSRIYSRGSRSLLPLLLLCLMVYVILKYLKKVTMSATEIATQELETLNSDYLAIYNLLLVYGFNPTLAKYITAQAGYETANFSSPLYKQANNAFGMKWHQSTHVKGILNGYATYYSLEQCVADYKDYWEYNHYQNIQSVENFVASLKNKNYFEAPQTAYYNGVNYFYKLYFLNG